MCAARSASLARSPAPLSAPCMDAKASIPTRIGWRREPDASQSHLLNDRDVLYHIRTPDYRCIVQTFFGTATPRNHIPRTARSNLRIERFPTSAFNQLRKDVVEDSGSNQTACALFRNWIPTDIQILFVLHMPIMEGLGSSVRKLTTKKKLS